MLFFALLILGVCYAAPVTVLTAHVETEWVEAAKDMVLTFYCTLEPHPSTICQLKRPPSTSPLGGITKGGSWRHGPNSTSPIAFISGTSLNLSVNNTYQFSVKCCEEGTLCDFNVDQFTFTNTLVTEIEIPPLFVTHLNRSAILLSWFGPSVYLGFSTEFYIVSWSNTTTFEVQTSVRIDIPPLLRRNHPPLNSTFQSLTIANLLTGGIYYLSVQGTNNFSTTSKTISTLIGYIPDSPRIAQLLPHSIDAMTVILDDIEENGAPTLLLDFICGWDRDQATGVSHHLNVQPTSDSTYVLQGLILSKSYYCRVRASNRFGSSEYGPSNPNAVLLALAPGAPSNITLQYITPHSAIISWILPSDNGAPIEGSIVEYSMSNSTTKVNLTANTNTQLLTSLNTSAQYFVRVSCFNEQGQGLFSTPIAFSLPEVPQISGFSLSGGDAITIENWGNHVFVNATSGGQELTFLGHNFLSFGPSRIEYQNLDGTLRYTCSPLEINDTFVRCLLAPGVGSLLHFRIFSGVVASDLSSDALSYPAPQVLPNTLHRPGQNPKEPLPALTALSEPVVMEGRHFGTDMSKVAVFYGPDSNPSKYNCTLQALNDSELTCQTAQGEQEQNMHFTVVVGDQMARGSDTYNYPTQPTISMMIGCTTCDYNANATCDCPTSGGLNLTVVGEALNVPTSLFIRGVHCDNVRLDPPNFLYCTLPEGTGGKFLPVVAAQGLFFSEIVESLSYAVPSIASASGCENLKNCNGTAETDIITINGHNFGSIGARAFVGGIECVETYHDLLRPHEIIYCRVPQGFGQNRMISVSQFKGETSPLNTNVTLSYALCPIGMYRSNLECFPCPAGTYQNQSDRFECIDCAPGFYAEMNASACIPCPNGTEQRNFASSHCTDCSPGYFGHQNERGTPSCSPCSPGTYSNLAGSSKCLSVPVGHFSAPGSSEYSACPLGQKTNELGSGCERCPIGTNGTLSSDNNCLDCPIGTFTNESGSPACKHCTGGTFNNYEGATQCFDCGPGRFSQSGSSTCSPCSPGRSNRLNRSTDCTDCAAGFYAPSGSTSCLSCQPGTNSSERSGNCSDCSPGWFAPNKSSTHCSLCPAGSSSGVGSPSCSLCDPGKYGPTEGLGSCIACPSGRFSISVGQTACDLCAPGSFANATGASVCELCHPGTFQSALGQRTCNRCPIKQVSLEAGRSDCSSCPADEIADPMLNRCVPNSVQRAEWKSALMGLGITWVTLGTMTLILIVCFRHNEVIHHSQPRFLCGILLGSIVLYMSACLFVADQTTALCHLKHLFLNLGANLILSSLLVRAYRLDRIFNPKTLHRTAIYDWHLAVPVSVVLCYDIVCIFAWWGASPSAVDQLTGRCVNSSEPWIHTLFWWWKAAGFVVLALLVYRCRKIDPRFNETWMMCLFLNNIIFVLLMLTVLSYAGQFQGRVWTILFVCLLLYLTASSIIFLLWDKAFKIWRAVTKNERLLGSASALSIRTAVSVQDKELKNSREREGKQNSKNSKEHSSEKKAKDRSRDDNESEKRYMVNEEEPVEETEQSAADVLAQLAREKEEKARILDNMLERLERAKQNMETEIKKMNGTTADILALETEIERRTLLAERAKNRGSVPASTPKPKVELVTLDLEPEKTTTKINPTSPQLSRSQNSPTNKAGVSTAQSLPISLASLAHHDEQEEPYVA